jgi:His-Xaa-Ser system protein HxsD
MKTLTLDPKIYPLEAILNCCYSFIDRAYIYLDKNKKQDHIDVFLKGKEKLNNKQWETLKGEFLNELLYSTVRYQISKNNRKIREYIIGRALYNTSFSVPLDQPKQEGLDYLEDPLGIAIPWEKKYGKNKKNKSKV